MASPYVERAAGRIAFREGKPLDPTQDEWWQEGYRAAALAQAQGSVPTFLKALQEGH